MFLVEKIKKIRYTMKQICNLGKERLNMKKNILKNIEWEVLICAAILCTIGLFALYSASLSANLDEFQKQVIWLIISIVIMIIVFFIDYEILVKISPILYRSINYSSNCSTIYKKNKWFNSVVFIWFGFATTK